MLGILQNFYPDLTETQLKTLEKFKNLLLFYNKQFNLTSIEDDTGFYIKHIADSLAGERFFGAGEKVVEIGSGGGFPSLPLKIVRDDLDFTLIESVGKKCSFLKTAAAELNLLNVRVINARAEVIACDKNFRESFGAACARAVAPLNTLCEYCAPFIKKGGKFIAYKTYNEDELENSLNARKILGLKLTDVYRYELPENYGSRSILVFEKIAETPPGIRVGMAKKGVSLFDMEKTCAVSGHRALKKDFSTGRLIEMLTALIEEGYTQFYVGMARGFDIVCCEQLITLKKNFDKLKVIACIPCVGQEKYYSFNEKVKYYGCIGRCDEVKILNESYVTSCMQMRNRYMVDNSGALFAYIYKYAGGTFYTVNYAKNKNKQIIYYKE